MNKAAFFSFEELFSPQLFSGEVFHSLGLLLSFNVLLFVVFACLYAFRSKIHISHFLSSVLSAGILVYTFFALRSISQNSDICLEIYRMGNLSFYSLLVYLSFIILLVGLPMFQRMSFLKTPFPRKLRILYALFVGAFLVGISAYYGFEKEKGRLGVWAKQLSIERDISLEMHLRRSEKEIATDPVIPQMVSENVPQNQIVGYIIENYLTMLAQDYDVVVLPLSPQAQEDPEMIDIVNSNISSSEPIESGSRFRFAPSGPGRIRYTALFEYMGEEKGDLQQILLGVEYKVNNENRGYASILGVSAPGKVVIPAEYSYAKYSKLELQFFKGSFPYPTHIGDRLYRKVFVDRLPVTKSEGFVHFNTLVNDDEMVMISRPVTGWLLYVFAAALIGVLVFIIITAVPGIVSRRRDENRPGYYRRRISTILMLSMSTALIIIITVSVVFVFNRNRENLNTLMSDKINSIRSIMENQLRLSAMTENVIPESEVYSVMKAVAEIEKTDITLYDNTGHLLMTTVPDRLSRTVVPVQMDSVALDNITVLHRRFFLHREDLEDHPFYSMYAPLMNNQGQRQAIICSPYADNSFDFQRDALIHLFAIITVFLILLLFARLLSATLLDRLFRPLEEMGAKMQKADIDHLEHIEYNRKDEISTLVKAYNRMVDDLRESSQKLAQAERDKAWSGMARQVAHEIKNPLTPMQLQIQRIQRLKQSGNPIWQEKFDDMCSILLEHIGILSRTASEFSEIAKLPTEPFTSEDLAAMLRGEITLFEGREDVKFEYLGIDSAPVLAPRPQLVRVIVNLLTNAVQALDGKEDAMVRVSLCNSRKDGFYDIVVEDNGPGVTEENQAKLFTPSFTTKTSGSGLGLAISRSILERCGATITYSKSFSLGGACFTITYPKASC